MSSGFGRLGQSETSHPAWFLVFLEDRSIRKTSRHTAKACRQDFAAIATLVAGDPENVVDMPPDAPRATRIAQSRRSKPYSSGRQSNNPREVAVLGAASLQEGRS